MWGNMIWSEWFFVQTEAANWWAAVMGNGKRHWKEITTKLDKRIEAGKMKMIENGEKVKVKKKSMHNYVQGLHYKFLTVFCFSISAQMSAPTMKISTIKVMKMLSIFNQY